MGICCVKSSEGVDGFEDSTIIQPPNSSFPRLTLSFTLQKPSRLRSQLLLVFLNRAIDIDDCRFFKEMLHQDQARLRQMLMEKISKQKVSTGDFLLLQNPVSRYRVQYLMLVLLPVWKNSNINESIKQYVEKALMQVSRLNVKKVIICEPNDSLGIPNNVAGKIIMAALADIEGSLQQIKTANCTTSNQPKHVLSIVKSHQSYPNIEFNFHIMNSKYISLPRYLSLDQLELLSRSIIDIEVVDQVIVKLGIPQSSNLINEQYSAQFVRCALCIKLNSLLNHQTKVNATEFIFLMKNDFQIKLTHSQQHFYREVLRQYSNLTEKTTSQSLRDTITIGNSVCLATFYMTIKYATHIIKTSQISMAFSFEALNGRIDAFRPCVHIDKNHPGQIKFAQNVIKLFATNGEHGLLPSEMSQHRNKYHKRVQDSYSLRCAPQVHGFCLDILKQSIEKFEEQMNNPQTNHILVQSEQYPVYPNTQRVIQAFDALILACHQISSISLIRSERILNDHLNKLPFKIQTKSQYMQLDYLYWQCSQLLLSNKALTYPLSADSINGRQYKIDVSQSVKNMYNKMEVVMNNILTIIGLQIVLSTRCIRWDKQQSGFDGGKLLTNLMEEQMKGIGQYVPTTLKQLKEKSMIFIQIIK